MCTNRKKRTIQYEVGCSPQGVLERAPGVREDDCVTVCTVLQLFVCLSTFHTRHRDAGTTGQGLRLLRLPFYLDPLKESLSQRQRSVCFYWRTNNKSRPTRRIQSLVLNWSGELALTGPSSCLCNGFFMIYSVVISKMFIEQENAKRQPNCIYDSSVWCISRVIYCTTKWC